jgi:MtN3 and saliva related transmembrane protein
MESFLGYFAACCTTLAFLPQAIKVIKTKDTAAISLSMYIIFTIGVISWFFYGIVIASKPVIFANLITFLFAFVILIVKMKEGK